MVTQPPPWGVYSSAWINQLATVNVPIVYYLAKDCF